MNRSKHFRAPWGVTLIVMTVFSLSIVCGVMVLGLVSGPGNNLIWIGSMILIPGIFLFIMPFFIIRGFVLTGDSILVKRLGWNSRISLDQLNSIEFDSSAMKGSIRTLGNGGFFAFCGKYRNKKLGPYRAFVTHLRNTVVLRFPAITIVISPEDPERFVSEIKKIKSL
jgi:hypothetical protein